MTRVAPVAALLLGLLTTLPAAAQSEGPSQVSALSIAPSVEVAASVVEALPAGSKLFVRGIEVVGESVLVTVAASAEGASFVIELAAGTVSALGIIAGTAVSAVVVSGGILLEVAGEAIAFLPDAASRALIHHEKL
jgi:hypothetical protein